MLSIVGRISLSNHEPPKEFTTVVIKAMLSPQPGLPLKQAP